ncbi:MAG: nuclear envelope integral membrane protein, partial [Pirellulales bacterium]|nr:nuclear envelope integral membrane protein [Pirellulales bacterium]
MHPPTAQRGVAATKDQEETEKQRNRETEKQRWERRNHCQSLDGKVHPNPFFVSFAPFVVNSTHLVSHDQIKEKGQPRRARRSRRNKVFEEGTQLADYFLDCQIKFAQDATLFTV